MKMAQFKIAFVAITLLFCFSPNGSGQQQYQDPQGRSQLRDWQRSRNRPVTRSVAPSPYQIASNSSPDITTRSRQRTRYFRTATDSLPDPRYSPLGTFPEEDQEFPTRGKDANFRTSRQRTPHKTLEDSLNTEWYQKRPERQQAARRNGLVDSPTELPTLRRRSDNVGIEPSSRRFQRQRGRQSEDTQVSSGDIAPTAPRPRGAFRGRVTFQDTTVTANSRDTPKRSRNRDAFTSRYQNAETTEPTAAYNDEITRQQAVINQEYPGVVSATPTPSVQQFQPLLGAVANNPVQQLDVSQKISGPRNDAIFPNLSTQQFSTDPWQFGRPGQIPIQQQFPYIDANQYEGTPTQRLPSEEPTVAAVPEFASQPDQLLRRIDSNNAERTPQFIPLEPQKGRNNFRSRARTTSTARTFETSPEVTVQPNTIRSRQGSFRSRTRPTANTEASSTATPSPRGRTVTGVASWSQQEKENIPPRKMVFRGRTRAQTVALPQQEAKERSFTEASEALSEQQAPVSPPSRLAKPFRGNATAKITQTAPEDEIDVTANYPKEFLDKLKSSKKFAPPSSRGVPGEGIARLKRKQFPTTETRSDAPEKEQTTEIPPVRQTSERYSQRFYKRLSAKSAAESGPKSTPGTQPPVAANSEPEESLKPTTAATAEVEISTTKQPETEERRKFVPKKKLTLEERKQRIARLKEKLRKNATEDELKTEESKESIVVREGLLLQANTHPGSREVPLTETKRGQPKRSRGGVRFDDSSSSRYDLITLGSEENARSVALGKREGSTTSTTTTAAPTSTITVPTTTPAVSSTTATLDFAVLNVTLFPSTRHRFSARINSTANFSLPPDVELIATTVATTALEQNPDTLSVNKLFNSSGSTTTTTTTTTTSTTFASVETTTSTTTAPSIPTTRSSAPSTATTTTTKRSTSKKKSSGRKKSKKPKSKPSNARTTTTKKPTASKATTKTTTTTTKPPTAATVRPTADNAATNSSNSPRPLSLSLSDVETIINDTISVVNSNPMTGPSPATAPRSELNALTPETILNTTETTTTLSKTNSSSNSTNRLENSQCANGSCTDSKSQSLHFGAADPNRPREPIPYARNKGTTKTPDALRKIFVYGVFPNSTVLRKPFTGGQYEAASARRPSAPSTTPYTPGDYYVFGVYPNNSVVRRRGWKTFDYEKYQSPYVIFGIYPNNTIVKKFPNGTTINDEFMVSDNEIRKTLQDGKVYKGCTCLNGVHDHATTPETAERTTTTTTTTTSTTAAPEEVGDATTETSGAGESETERNAKDDAESIDVQLEGISETEQPETTEGTTTTREEETNTTTAAPMGEIEESTVESLQGSLAEAEEADMVSTPESQQESTTTASESEDSEGLENAEEADNASTPSNLEDTTNSLEREESQNAGAGGSIAEAEDRDEESTESSGSDGLSEAEEEDSEEQTERSENIQERTTESSDSERTTEGRSGDIEEGTTARSESTTTERNELEERIENIESTTVSNENQERTTATDELLERIEKVSEGTTASNEPEERTTARSDNESTTESNQNQQGTTARDELLERIENTEEGTTASNLLMERTTERNELEERIEKIENTTENNENQERTTARNEVEEIIEKIGEGTTARNELEEGTTATNELLERIEKTEEGTTASNELAERTSARNEFEESVENIEEETTSRNEIGDRTTARNETTESTTAESESEDRIEKIEEGTTARNEVEYRTTARTDLLEKIEKIDEGTTARSDLSENIEKTGEGTTASNELEERIEKIEEGTTARNEFLERVEKTEEGTTVRSETEERTTATNDLLEKIEKLDEGTTSSNEVEERIEKIEEGTTARNELLEKIEKIDEDTTDNNEVEESPTPRNEIEYRPTVSNEVEESSTARNVIEERTTTRDELLERIEKIDEIGRSNEVEDGPTARVDIFGQENVDATTEIRTTERTENLLESTTRPAEENNRILENPTDEGTTGLEISNNLSDDSERLRQSTAERKNKFQDRNFGFESLFGIGTTRKSNSEEKTTENSPTTEKTQNEQTTAQNYHFEQPNPYVEQTIEIYPFDQQLSKPTTTEDDSRHAFEPNFIADLLLPNVGKDSQPQHAETPTEKPSTEGTLIIDLNFDAVKTTAEGPTHSTTTASTDSDDIKEAKIDQDVSTGVTDHAKTDSEDIKEAKILHDISAGVTDHAQTDSDDIKEAKILHDISAGVTDHAQTDSDDIKEAKILHDISAGVTDHAKTDSDDIKETKILHDISDGVTDHAKTDSDDIKEAKILHDISAGVTDHAKTDSDDIKEAKILHDISAGVTDHAQTDSDDIKEAKILHDISAGVTDHAQTDSDDIKEIKILQDISAGVIESAHIECPPQSLGPATTAPAVDSSFDGYVYDRPTENPFSDGFAFPTALFGGNASKTEPPVVEADTPPATSDYDIDVRALGDLIGRFTTDVLTQSDGSSIPATTPGADVQQTKALFPLSLEFEEAAASGSAVKKRNRKAVDDLDEPSSLTNLAYRALSSSETIPTPTPPPLLTTTTTARSAPRAKPTKVKNLSKTTVTAYKNLTTLTSTPPPDEVFIVTPVASTQGNLDTDYFRRGKVKFVTLTPGVVVTTNIHDENDILTMSSQHVQKVTKAPAKIPDNFLSTVYGEIEEKASSPIPDILKNMENDLQGDGLSASLARRIITLALEKAMTSTPSSLTSSSTPSPSMTTPKPASYIQRITTGEPTTKKPTTTTTKKPTTTTTTTTTKKPTTTRKPKTTTTTTTTTAATTTTSKKPITSTTTRKPTKTTTESHKTVLITPKKAAAVAQQLTKNPAAAITSPEYLGSTTGPAISDSQTAEVVSLEPLTVYFPSEKQTTTAGSQRVTEDLNQLLSGLWEQEQTSTTTKLPETSKKSTKSKSVLSKEASASLSESDLKILEAILQQQGANGATQDLEQIVQNQIRLAEEVRKASRNLKKKKRPTTTTTTERPAPLGLGFLLNLFGAGSRTNGVFSNEPRNSRRPRPVLSSFSSLNASNVTPDPFNELEEGSTTAERSARGELVSAAIDVTKAVSKFMGTVLTSAAQSFQNFFRNLGR